MSIEFSIIASQEKAEGKRFDCCSGFERVFHIIPFCSTIFRMTLTKFRSTVRRMYIQS